MSGVIQRAVDLRRRFFGGIQNPVDGRLEGSDPETTVTRIGHEVARRFLPKARIVLWLPGLFESATRGWQGFSRQPLSRSTVGLAFPQLWVFERNLPRKSAPPGWFSESHEGVLGIFLSGTSAGDQLWGLVFLSHKDPSLFSTFAFCVNAGNTYDGLPHVDLGLRFLEQEFVGLERHRLCSDRVAKGYRMQNRPVPEVSVVTLRRSVSERRDGPSESREWSCQWLVSGHWRRQWMPKGATWEPRYISPYLKGDPSKPLRADREVVYAVSR